MNRKFSVKSIVAIGIGAKPFRTADILCMAGCALLLALSLTSTAVMGTRFYNPFIR